MAYVHGHRYLKIKDALRRINQKVSIIGVIIEYNLPRKSKGTDWYWSLKIVDQTYPKPGFTVVIFASSPEQLPRGSSLGDIILLEDVLIKRFEGEINAIYNKRLSSATIYTSRHYPGDQESKLIIDGLRKWLPDFHIDEGSNVPSLMRGMRQGERRDLVCKILHTRAINENQWMAFVWDGTDSPPVNIGSKLENERENPLPLQLEPQPLPRDLLCTFPTVGTVLRIIIDKIHGEHALELLNTGKWVKFVDILCTLRGELWCGVWSGALAPLSKLRYVSNDIVKASERSYTERLTSELGRIPYSGFPWCSQITEVDHQHPPFVTLMYVLTHSEVTAKFKSVVRVVAAFPWRAEDFCHLGTYCIRLTIEDPTARLHAYLYAEDAERFFGGYPSVDLLTRKINSLLGVTQNDDGTEMDDAPRNPLWVQCCLKSYYLDKNDTWGTRKFRIFDTRHVR